MKSNPVVTDGRAASGDNGGTGLPKPSPKAAHVTGNKRSKSPLTERLNKSRERAKTINQRNAYRTVEMRVRVHVDVHEAVCDLADAAGCRLTDILNRCIIDGLTRYANLPNIKKMFDGFTFGVLDQNPELSRSHIEYGREEQKFRNTITTQAEQNRPARPDRIEEARSLGLRSAGRRPEPPPLSPEQIAAMESSAAETPAEEPPADAIA